MPDFNHYIYLMNACNIYLPLYITAVGGYVEQLYLRLDWMLTLMEYGKRLLELGRFVPAAKRSEAEDGDGGSLPGRRAALGRGSSRNTLG